MLVAINTNAQWIETYPGMYGETVWSLSSVGNDIYIGANDLYRSTNYGVNWVNVGINRRIDAIASIGNNIFAGTGQGIFRSTNNGVNWTRDIAIFANSFAVIGNNIFAGTTNGVLISTNYGTTWILTSLHFRTYHLKTNGINLFAGVDNFSQSGIYLSSNNGVNWIQTSLIGSIGVNSLYASGNRILAGINNGVYQSTNSGLNWSRIGFNDTNIYAVASIGNTIFACPTGYYLIGPIGMGVYLSTNNGTTWINRNQGFPYAITVWTLLILNDYIYAGTFESFVWRRPLSEIIGIQNISTETPSKYSLSQNYPNPFNPMTNVKFSIVNSGDVKLVIYDIQGREVQTLVNERLQPGTYEAAFDGSMLNSSIYFYKLATNGFTETKKMILIK